MTTNLNTVKNESRATYHHGDLRQALMASAEEILRDEGVAGFSLRKAARRSGVSPAAPAHHFGDARGLLTALATTGFERLTGKMIEAASIAVPASSLESAGQAYLDFARSNPGLFSIMWMRDAIDIEDAAYLAAGRSAFAAFASIARGAPVDPATGPQVPEPSLVAAWALVHGLARLHIDGALANLPPDYDAQVIAFMRSIVPSPAAPPA